MKFFNCLFFLVCFSVQPVFAACDTDLTASTDHLTVYDVGEIYDSNTGLIWKKCLQGFSGTNCETEGVKTTFTWTEALGEAGTTWRLPNIKELQSIVEEGCYNPAITDDATIFPGTYTTGVWSNSPILNGPFAGMSLYVGFNTYGLVYPSGRTSAKHVRLVRDAPAE